MEAQIIKVAIDTITPIFEGAMVSGAHYAKACGRNMVTSVDVKYGMRYCAMNLVGKHSGTMFPELQETDSSEDDEDSSIDEEDEPFTRYMGEDPIMIAMNKSYDEWHQWIPHGPVECMLKDAIDKNE